MRLRRRCRTATSRRATPCRARAAGRRARPGRGRRIQSSAAESTAAARVILDCGSKLVWAEVRPERVGEDELRIRRLPEQEVRHPQLARGADDEVGIRHLRCVEMARERVLVDRLAGGGDPPGGFDELCPPAVVKGDPEYEP